MKETAVVSRKIKCKVCEIEKEAFNMGQYKSGRGYKYVDADGKKFNAKVCPPCHAQYMKYYQRIKRNAQ